MSLRRVSSSLALGILISAGAASAATETYTIDPNHSNVGFSVRHFFSKVPGRFTKYEGTITLDPKNLSTAVVSVTIDAASINTGVDDRDSDLRSANFFDVAKYPTITFVSTGVTAQGPRKATVKGNLTMHGVTKPVTLEAEVLGFSPDPWGGYRGGFEARTLINRMDYGVSWSKTVEGGGLVVGNEVDIVLDIEGTREAPKPAAPVTPAPKK
ncbi:MAG TPA: YceI family protein [Candidatus Polarisedimenticolia bacterium]|nr:YceI family protein [Candidatus Polarisedimenticolia bacterium]